VGGSRAVPTFDRKSGTVVSKMDNTSRYLPIQSAALIVGGGNHRNPPQAVSWKLILEVRGDVVVGGTTLLRSPFLHYPLGFHRHARWPVPRVMASLLGCIPHDRAQGKMLGA
jgi:hypothetical protein